MTAALPTHHTQYFHIEGIRCARCVCAIESALYSQDAITEARVNMSTNRLTVSWQGAEDRVSALAQTVASLGYRATPYGAEEEESEPGSEDRLLLRCMVVSGFAMGNLMLLSFALWGSDADMMGVATRDLLHWISALIALPAIVYAGRPFFASALKVLLRGHTNMDVPISLAIVLASVMSLSETYHSAEHAYFDSAVMLLFFLLVGRWLDARARGRARAQAQRLLSMMQGYATTVQDGVVRTLPISQLKAGMVLQIAAGEKIPADAEIIRGESEIDTSLVTGESLPMAAGLGDMVYSGTLNLSAPLEVRVLKASEDSLLADMIRLMEQAEQGRARYVRLADKAARLYTPVVHVLAAGACAGWIGLGGMAWQDALMIAVTTLIITCPCALGLAVPVVQVLATGWLMKRGVLVKSGDALERLAAIDTIIFDKTGTLTQGKAALIGAYPDEILQLAASLAAHSKHPYSRAISAAYEGVLLPVQPISETAGMGIEAVYHGRRLFLGKTLSHEGEAMPQCSTVSFYEDQRLRCQFQFADPLRTDSRQVIALFKRQQIPVWLLSGDRQPIVVSMAQAVDMDHYQGDQLPHQKTEIIRRLQAAGHTIMMVGDGLNDAPSLAQADVSLSPATGIDITQNTADMVFQGSQLAPVWHAWRMACFSTRLVRQNFLLAIGYNAVAIPLAIAGYVTPLVAAIAMSLSSLLVIANSFRINRMPEEIPQWIS